MTAPNVRDKPYTDLARAASWYLRHKGSDRATMAYLAALRAVRNHENPDAYQTQLCGLWVHVLPTPTVEEALAELHRPLIDTMGFWARGLLEDTALTGPHALVWTCSPVDVLLPGTHLPPSVRAFMEMFSGTTTIEETRIDQFFEAVEPLMRDQKNVKDAALFLLKHVGKRARLYAW